mmetsp:Transcript_10132/g.24588  ORF Transcript_10132/g.24588 Transcript_10132/m.24588 type:complete len:214 (-) Transcript_10132:904-1545(-)
MRLVCDNSNSTSKNDKNENENCMVAMTATMKRGKGTEKGQRSLSYTAQTTRRSMGFGHHLRKKNDGTRRMLSRISKRAVWNRWRRNNSRNANILRNETGCWDKKKKKKKKYLASKDSWKEKWLIYCHRRSQATMNRWSQPKRHFTASPRRITREGHGWLRRREWHRFSLCHPRFRNEWTITNVSSRRSVSIVTPDTTRVFNEYDFSQRPVTCC